MTCSTTEIPIDDFLHTVRVILGPDQPVGVNKPIAPGSTVEGIELDFNDPTGLMVIGLIK